MLRSKSPFKKKQPQIEQEEIPARVRPLLHHYSSVQELQELQKQQHFLNGNAWAQQRSRVASTSVGDLIMPLSGHDGTDQRVAAAKPAKQKKVPPPLKLIPEAANEAVPTQRDSLEDKKHRVMQAKLNLLAHNNEPSKQTSQTRSSTTSDTNASIEHIIRPKSPGKKLFQKFFRHTSSETPPKISPEFEETPEKAVKILGKESLSRKESRAKLRTSEEKKLLSQLDFKCVGDDACGRPTRSRANTDASTSSMGEFHAPTDREIRSIGGVGRHPTRVPTMAAQRTVSEAASLANTTDVSTNTAQRDLLPLEHQHMHLQYLNNAMPPTPPSKDSGKGKARPPVTQVPAMDVEAVLNNNPTTPDTAFRVFSKGDTASSPLSHHNAYLHLVLNKPGFPSIRGAPASVKSTYGFVTSPSAELASESFGSPVAHFIEPPVPRSAGLPSSRDTSFGSSKWPASIGLSRRWSDTSLTVWKAQSEAALPYLPPTFYSPRSFIASSENRSFTRPSANDDPSLYYLPQLVTGVGDLESCNSSEGKGTPPASAESSFGSISHAKDKQISASDTTPLSKQRRFVVKKRCSSNIKAAARNHAERGLGLLAQTEETMHHNTNSTSIPVDANFPAGPASAIPRPLNLKRLSHESLPANEELDAFLTLHMHLDHSTEALHRLINHKFSETQQDVNTKHKEVMDAMSSSFADIVSKINGVADQNVKAQGDVDACLAEENKKLRDMMELLQKKVLAPVSQVMEKNTSFDQAFGRLTTRIAELEKTQKELLLALASKDKPEKQIANVQPIVHEQTSASSAHTSPHHSFAGQNLAYTFPAPYSNTPVTSGGGLVQYMPFYGETGALQPGWTGQSLDAGFAKLSREQRAQLLAGRYGGGAGGGPPPLYANHPAYKYGERANGVTHATGKDESHEI